MSVDNRNYDVIIIGGGPAGLSAGLYTSRARLNSLLIEKGLVGGQITNAERIENYPGFHEGISGIELADRMHQQATKYGLKTVLAEATGIQFQEEKKVVRTNKDDFTAKVIILAGGSRHQKLGIPGEEEFTGKGVSYCATCDGFFFKDQPVTVVGGGDAAITQALHLAKLASKITVIHRRRRLRASRILQEKAYSEPKIDFLWDTIVEKIEGKDSVKQVQLHQIVTGEYSTLPVVGIFISIGLKPDTNYLTGIIPLDAFGHIITNEKMEAKIPGILAAGDIRHNSARQAITATGDGATAAIYTEQFLTE